MEKFLFTTESRWEVEGENQRDAEIELIAAQATGEVEAEEHFKVKCKGTDIIAVSEERKPATRRNSSG